MTLVINKNNKLKKIIFTQRCIKNISYYAFVHKDDVIYYA
jgi:hypothetical protein